MNDNERAVLHELIEATKPYPGAFRVLDDPNALCHVGMEQPERCGNCSRLRRLRDAIEAAERLI